MPEPIQSDESQWRSAESIRKYQIDWKQSLITIIPNDDWIELNSQNNCKNRIQWLAIELDEFIFSVRCGASIFQLPAKSQTLFLWMKAHFKSVNDYYWNHCSHQTINKNYAPVGVKRVLED